MRLRLTLHLIPLLGIACQSSGGTSGTDVVITELPPFPMSGSRLKAIWWEPESGQRIFRHWRDTNLNIDCEVPTTDGASRCVPTSDYADELIDGAFSDAACTHPVWGALSPAKTFLVAHPFFGCNSGPRVYRLGSPFSGGSQYAWMSGQCVRSSDALAGLHPLIDVTDEMAAVSIKRGPSVGGLAGLALVSSDGARAPWGWWDEQRQQRCDFPWSVSDAQPILASDGRWHCMPRTDFSLWRRDFVGSCATGRAVVLPHDRCAAINGVRNGSDGACPSHVITEAPKARLDCPGPDEVWSLEMLAPDGLPVATLSDPQGEGRLSARWIETGAGKVLAGVWDAQLGTMCAPALTIENATVCVPVANVEDMGYFGESLCLNRLLTSVNCAPARFLTVVESLMSRRLAEVKSLEPYTGMVFESRNRACGPAGGDQRQVAGPHFSEGARVPLSDLAALHETIQ